MASATAHHRAEENTGQEKIGGIGRAWRRSSVLLFCAGLILAMSTRAVDDLAQLQQRFDRETDGVRKAKLMRKLGDAQFAKERQAAAANDYVTVGLVMESYRDNVRAALQALKKAHPDAEKHSAGYRELEIHTGQSIREIRDVILTMPEPYRPPMQVVEHDLMELDSEMLKLLFPRRPGEQPRPPQGPSNEKKTDTPPEKQP
jgi:hypothetical protein